MNTLDESVLFFSNWLRAPLSTGAICPSSRWLARAMAEQVDLSIPGHVVELGAGTGGVTKALLKRGVPAERLLVFERNPRFAEWLRWRFPEVRILEADARQIDDVVRAEGCTSVAAVVSSLPLRGMPVAVRTEIVERSLATLGRSRPFIQYTYGLRAPIPAMPGRALAEVAARAWINLPPATVWRVESLLDSASDRHAPEPTRADGAWSAAHADR